MFKKVLILSASAGAGHTRAAQALERAFMEMSAAEEVKHVDALEYTTKIFKTIASKAYIDLVNKAPHMLGWFYDVMDKPWKNERLMQAIDMLNTQPLVRLINKYQPDLAVCTHFTPADMISWLKEKKTVTCPLAIVVTDFDIHANWLCRYCDRYFVALDETGVHLEKLGIPADRITVSGIPVDPVFARRKDKAAMRLKLGLREDRTTILVSAGGFGVGPVENLFTALLDLQHEAQIVAVCGKSEELKRNLEHLAGRIPAGHRVAVQVVGYTTDMDEYMAAADMLVGKTGGLTTSEALARDLIMVVVNPIPGQEERNADHLLEEGAALRCNNLPAIAFKIDRLLDDPARMAAMKQNIRRIARPRAAYDIVSTLLQLKSAAQH
ncbi:MAG: glycosyltransferase [Proteobacteria bacterium]|nr:glycosyltransferase [Pseudomonadota bacterium]